ncbi:hypothetical protein F4803DRAFT_549886 [Xylaria telfairii]|nr:hypothetical protein F4803DRAFT_549886 [Xylaria telfairii]
MDNLVETPKPRKPRARQILKQFPQGRGEKRRNPEESCQHQPAKRCHQQMPPQGVTLEVPIRDLEPLQILNAYRRSLGIGPSPNLISSAIYSYDPTTIAECYEKTMRRDFSNFPQIGPSIRDQTDRPLGFSGAPIDSPTSDYGTSNTSLSYQHESSDEYSSDTRPSTSQQSGDGNSVSASPGDAKLTNE